MRRLILLAALTSCRSTPAKPVVVAPAPAPAKPEPSIVATTPIEDPACERVEFPSVGASVLIVPGATMTRALAPVVHAACSCSRAGHRLLFTTEIAPEAGAVTAVVHGNAPVDACIRRRLHGHFEPFALASDCIDCGPERYPIFRGTPQVSPTPRAHSRIMYTFTFVHR